MIKKEKIGSSILTKVGWITIEEGKESLYKKLNLDIFEDEVKQISNDKQRSVKSKRKNDTIDSDLSI
tara:strand:+ start:539 stop:739 length:201 start_codon:yes stop_codon:yes gene_type:complete